MSNTLKKFSAISLSLTTAICLSGVTLALPTVALGATTTELQAQITALLAQIQALQAQLGTAQGTASVPTITRDLTLGSTGTDVKELQQFLNAQGYAVAASGAGSVGNETTTFGSLTKAALAKYQAAKGISPAAGYFGAITRAYLSSVAVTTPTTPTTPTTRTGMSGSQGTMDVKLAASPASGEDLYENEAGQPVYGIEVKASDSEVYVSRVKLQFGTAINNIINKVSLYRDGVLLTEKVINSDAVTRITSSNYTTQLTGFESKVDKGATATFEVRVNALSSIDAGYTTFTVLAPVNAIRAVDGANISLDGPSAVLGTNTVNVKQSGASAALLTISKNASTPGEANVVADATGKAEKVTLLIMNVKAEKDSVKLTDLTANVIVSGAGTSTIAFLYDGTALVDSATVSGTTAAFADFSFTVPKDTTKQLTVKADITGVTNAETLATSTVTSSALAIAEGSDGIALTDTTNKTVSAIGNQIHLFKVAPIFSLTSATLTKTVGVSGVSSTTGDANIKFTVTAKGGDVTVTSTGALQLMAFREGVASTSFTPTYSVTGGTLSGTVYTIAQDSAATFEAGAQITTGGWTSVNDGSYDVRLIGFQWGPKTSAASTTFLDDLSTNPFKTNIVQIR